jgi:FixJ family two-component response regulator
MAAQDARRNLTTDFQRSWVGIVDPECIVLDVHLGGLSGFDLQDLLEAGGNAPPIIFITAHEDMLAERARSGGAFGYLRKPFETQALIALLRQHLTDAE